MNTLRHIAGIINANIPSTKNERGMSCPDGNSDAGLAGRSRAFTINSD
ncbi:MAG: hypothetical protein ACFE7S_04220 [Candidatus Hodarchaeota archaeon]